MPCYFFFYFCHGCPRLCFAFSSVVFVNGNNAAKSECKHKYIAIVSALAATIVIYVCTIPQDRKNIPCFSCLVW